MKDQSGNNTQILADRQRRQDNPSASLNQNSHTKSIDNVLQDLSKSEERYRALFESMLDGMCQHELVYNEYGSVINYRILDVNPAYEKILNLRKEDVVGKLATDVYQTEEAPYLEIYARVAESGQPTNFETYFPPLLKHFSISVFSPAETQFATVFEDVTERKHAEQEILKLSRFPAENPNPVYRVDRKGVFLYQNKAGLELTERIGIKKDEIVVPEILSLVHEVLSTGQYINREISYKNLELSLTVVPVVETNYANIYVLDITGRKHAEQRLIEHEEKLVLALEGAEADSWEMDLRTGSFTFGDRWLAYLGYEVGEMPQTISAMYAHIHPDDLESSKKTLEWYLAGEIDLYEVETRVRKKDGTYVWVLSRGRIVAWEADKTPRKIIGINFDINDRKNTEKERHQLQILLSSVIQQSPVPIVVASAQDKVVQACNYACKEVLGILDEPDLVGQSMRGLNVSWRIIGADGEPVPADRFPLLLALDGVGTPQSEITIIRKDGSHRNCLMEGMPIYDQEDNLIAGFIIFPDITRSKQTEIALRESEAQFRSLVESTSDWIWCTDKDAVYTYASPRVKELLGYEPEEIVGRTPFDFMPEEDRGKVADRREKLTEQYEPIVALENTFRHKDGYSVVLEASGLPIIGESGELLGYRGVDRDITQRKQAEDELRFKNRVFESGITANSAADSDGNITHVNSAFLKIWGYDEEKEVIGKQVSFFIKDIADAEKIILHLDEFGEWEGEYQGIKKDGSTFKAYGLATIVQNEKAEKIGYQSVVLDITDRKRAEQDREKLYTQLQQAQKMESVGRLAGGVAHDFNNMLSVILGHTEMALAQLDSTNALFPDLREIQKAAQRSADLTRQLLAFARKQTVTRKTLELNNIVGGMLSMLNRLIGEDIDLLWEAGNDLWLIKMDPSQIDQILANLCVNARDAINGVGNVTIKTRNTVLDDIYCAGRPGSIPGEYVELSVSDSGCGMEEQVLGYVFEPFFTTKQSGHGTGLGLSTVYGIVKQNEGFIDIWSKSGEGTTFWIYLPRYTGETQRDESTNTVHFKAFHQKVILLVEDEPAILDLGKMMLEKLGYQVLTAGTPSEAIKIAEAHKGSMDILITDVIMPEMDGRNLSEKLLAHYPELKCVFMSGYTADVIAHHGVLQENMHFIQKPFTLKELGSVLSQVVDSK